MSALTLAAVRKLQPCSDSYKRVSAILPKRGKITAQQARDAGCTFDDMVWVASAVALNDKAVERRLRHWMADCATRVLHIYERDYPSDMRVRAAIQAGHNFADGLISDAARDAAWDAARDAAWDAAGDGAGGAAWAAARDAAGDGAGDAARAAAWDGARAAARDAARAAEEAWQFDRLIYWLSDDSPVPLEMPALPERKAA